MDGLVFALGSLRYGCSIADLVFGYRFGAANGKLE